MASIWPDARGKRGPRVGPIVDRHQMIDVDLGVALGGAQAGVAEHLLDGAQVGALAQQVGGEAVAEGVGRDPADPLPQHPAGQLPAGLARIEPAAAAAEEDAPRWRRGRCGRGGQQAARAGAGSVQGRPAPCAPSGHDAILAALALADVTQGARAVAR